MKRKNLDYVVSRLVEEAEESLAELRQSDDARDKWRISGISTALHLISLKDKKYEKDFKKVCLLMKEAIFYKKIDAFLEDYLP